jgi:hypothetical protein
MSALTPRRWYQIAVSYLQSPEAMQRELPFSKAKRCTLGAIACLPRDVAQQLEEAGLGWSGWQRVAHADGPEAQRERAAIELQRMAMRRHPAESADPGRALANELLEAGPVPVDYRRPPLAAARTCRGRTVPNAA